MIKHASLLAAWALLLPTCAATAAPSTWTTHGPYGGNVTALVIDPSAPSTLYAAVYWGQVYKSTDNGATWASLRTYADVLAAAPHAAGTVYSGYGASVGRSTDAGASWRWTDLWSLGVNAVRVLAEAPSSGRTTIVYAGTDAGVFRSTDGGGTWAPAGQGIGHVTALVIDPLKPSTIYATAGGNVYRSWDGGDNWTLVLSRPSQHYEGLAIHPTNPLTLFAGSPEGAARSVDGGATWHDIPVAATTLAIDPIHPNVVYAVSGGTVARSTDHGTSWAAVGAGLEDAVGSLAVSPSASGTVFAGSVNWAGVVKTTDAGASWARVNQGLLGLAAQSVAVHPAVPQTVLAVTTGAGLFKSTDGGQTWARSGKGLTPPWPNSLAFAPISPSTAYAATASGTFRSTDSGDAWSFMGDGLPAPFWILAVDPDSESTLWASGGLRPDQGLFRSTDAGGSWSGRLLGDDVSTLAFDSTNPATIYAGGEFGLKKSTDHGATWGPASAGLADRWVYSLAIDPSDPSRVYAGAKDDPSQMNPGVLKSTDAGVTWREANHGLPADRLYAPLLLVDPLRPHTLYASVGYVSIRGGIFRSTDSGEHWHSIGSSSAPEDAGSIDLAGNAVYAAGLGVWRVDSPVATFVKGDLDGDGQADLVFGNTADARRHQVWLMNGVERAGVADITPDTPSADWQVRGVDCFDTDGRSDLLLWNRATGQVEFWFLNGTTRVGAPKPLGGAAPVLPTNWEPVATADFNHHHSPDILWRNTTSGKLVVWAMYWNYRIETLVPTPNQAADLNWDVVAAQDYDDDGNVDLLWYNATSGKVVTWLLDATLTRTAGRFTTPAGAGDANWRPVASADYSRAGLPGTPPVGSPDIVWRNETSGNQVVWHMDFGSARVHGEFTSPAANAPALDWTIIGPR